MVIFHCWVRYMTTCTHTHAHTCTDLDRVDKLAIESGGLGSKCGARENDHVQSMKYTAVKHIKVELKGILVHFIYNFCFFIHFCILNDVCFFVHPMYFLCIFQSISLCIQCVVYLYIDSLCYIDCLHAYFWYAGNYTTPVMSHYAWLVHLHLLSNLTLLWNAWPIKAQPPCCMSNMLTQTAGVFLEHVATRGVHRNIPCTEHLWL